MIQSCHDRPAGRRRRAAPTGVALLLAAGSLGWWGRGGPLTYGGVMLAVALAYAVYAALDRSRLLAVFVACAAAVAVVLLLLQPAAAYAIGAASVGGMAVALGLSRLTRP